MFKRNFNKTVKEFEKRLRKETDKYQGIPVAISGGIDSGLLAALVNPKFVISVQLPGGRKYNEIKYAKKVARHLKLEHIIVKPNKKEFKEGVRQAVKAIGRPIPHFNIFPLWSMYHELAKMGVDKLILGDGPDETMAGYTRNLIMNYIYKIYEFDAFKPYKGMIDDLLKEAVLDYSNLTRKPMEDVEKSMKKHKSLLKAMNQVDIDLMRPDMDDMSNKIAEYFGIKNIRPYQDNKKFDKWQFNLPDEYKIGEIEYGKFILRLLAQKYLPKEISWRKVKVGGPVYPVNKTMGWVRREGEFGKDNWMKYQQDILDGKDTL